MRISDWSSDVCSSDLLVAHAKDRVVPALPRAPQRQVRQVRVLLGQQPPHELLGDVDLRRRRLSHIQHPASTHLPPPPPFGDTDVGGTNPPHAGTHLPHLHLYARRVTKRTPDVHPRTQPPPPPG